MMKIITLIILLCVATITNAKKIEDDNWKLRHYYCSKMTEMATMTMALRQKNVPIQKLYEGLDKEHPQTRELLIGVINAVYEIPLIDDHENVEKFLSEFENTTFRECINVTND